MRSKSLAVAAIIAASSCFILGSTEAQAKGSYFNALTARYGLENTRLDTCGVCHYDFGGGGQKNFFGEDFAGNNHDFAAIENFDSDGDGYTNLEELTALFMPGLSCNNYDLAEGAPGDLADYVDPDSVGCGAGPVDADGDGYASDVDCDDTDPAVNPGAGETTCDGIDNDCSAATEDAPDGDGDGESVCTDCDDADPFNYNGNTEDCGDGFDNNCDSLVDLDDPTCAPTCTDADSDGYFAEAGCGTAVDCNDSDSLINPGIVEIECDGIDNNCNGMADEELDLDGDGVGYCSDCDDADPANFPGNTEDCVDGFDNDCDGFVDDADADCQAPLCADITSKGACNEAGICTWVGNPKNGHCEDAPVCTPDESPEASCADGVDNDCDGAVDCADPDCGCPPPDCSQYGDRAACTGVAGCKWSGKSKVCEPG